MSKKPRKGGESEKNIINCIKYGYNNRELHIYYKRKNL